MPGRARLVAALAMALLVPAAILTVAGPGHSLRAAAWPTAGLAVLAAAWLAGLLALRPRQAEPGIRQLPRSWRGAYYAGLLVLLAGLIAWGPWTILTLHNVHYRRTAETSCI